MVIARETTDRLGAGGFRSRVSWGSILLGVVVALGVLFLLTLLGIALGFTIVDPKQDANPFSGIPVGSAIYFAIAHIVAFLVGGFAAGRLASSAWSSAALFHGAAVWALASFLILVSVASGVGAVISGTTSMISTVSGGAAKAVRQAAPDNLNLPNLGSVELMMPDDFLESLPQDTQRRLQQQEVTLQEIRTAGRAAMQQAISNQEQEQAKEMAVDALGTMVSNPSQADAEINRVVEQLTGPGGLISEADRQQALNTFAERLNIEPEDAEAIVQQLQQGMNGMGEQVRQALQQAREKAVQMAEKVTSAIASAAWWAFIISLLGLIAAIAGAIMGRPEHDRYGAA